MRPRPHPGSVSWVRISSNSRPTGSRRRVRPQSALTREASISASHIPRLPGERAPAGVRQPQRRRSERKSRDHARHRRHDRRVRRPRGDGSHRRALPSSEKAILIHVPCHRHRLDASLARLPCRWFDLACLARHDAGRALLKDVVRHRTNSFHASGASDGADGVGAGAPGTIGAAQTGLRCCAADPPTVALIRDCPGSRSGVASDTARRPTRAG